MLLLDDAPEAGVFSWINGSHYAKQDHVALCWTLSFNIILDPFRSATALKHRVHLDRGVCVWEDSFFLLGSD